LATAGERGAGALAAGTGASVSAMPGSEKSARLEHRKSPKIVFNMPKKIPEKAP